MPIREAAVVLGGRNYVAHFNLKTLASIDNATGLPPVEVGGIISNPNRVRFDVAAKLIWGAFRVMHPELTLDKLVDLIPAEPGSFAEILNIVAAPWSEAVGDMFGAEKSDPKPTGAPSAGTGAPSSRGPSSSSASPPATSPSSIPQASPN